MTAKPLPPHKAKPLIERFKKHASDLEVYEAATLRSQDLKDLLKQPNAWVVIGKSKWD